MPAEEVSEVSGQYPDGRNKNFEIFCEILSPYFAGEEAESQDDLLGLAELTSDELKAAFRSEFNSMQCKPGIIR